MIDIMPDDKEISKALNVLNSISDKLRYEKICEISEAQKNIYKELLEKFKQLHDSSPTDNAPKNLHNLKGEALENLVSYLLKYSLQGTTQGNGLTGGVPPVRFSM